MKCGALRKLLPFAAGAAALLCAAPASAGTDTSQFQVNVNVISGCALNTTPNLDFGNYVQGGGAASATTDISLTCSTGTIFVVALDYGVNGGSATNRFLQRVPPTGALNYNLYTEAAHTNVWKSTADGCATVTNPPPTGCGGSTGTGSAQTITVYGLIPGAQFPGGTGAFTDTITVTVTF